MESQLKKLAVICMTNSALSGIGSSVIVYSILRSAKKLTIPFRRIIFALSILDIIRSISVGLTILPSPKDEVGHVFSWAMGNTVTCTIQGLFNYTTGVAIPMYVCSLCFFYYSVVKLNMTQKRFEDRFEPYLHLIPIGWSLSCGIYGLSTQLYNSDYFTCAQAAYPSFCYRNPDVPCIRGGHVVIARMITYFLPTFISFVLIIFFMVSIACAVRSQEKKNQAYSFEASIRHSMKSQETPRKSVIFKTRDRFSGSSNNNSTYNEMVSRRLSTGSKKSSHKGREVMIQASLYISAFFLCNGLLWVVRIYSMITGKFPPTFISFLAVSLNPLQGMFYVFIYTRPHVNSLRRHSKARLNERYSYPRALWKVVKAGGDLPRIPRKKQGRRSSRHIAVVGRLEIDGSSATRPTQHQRHLEVKLPVPVPEVPSALEDFCSSIKSLEPIDGFEDDTEGSKLRGSLQTDDCGV